jgi:hypothetical protein
MMHRFWCSSILPGDGTVNCDPGVWGALAGAVVEMGAGWPGQRQD